jgi:hypothetical protein
MTSDYSGRPITQAQIAELEAQAAWEEKFPAVLRGEIKPADRDDLWNLASYCATFERRFALATKLIAEGIETDPSLLDDWMKVAHFAGWAVQAGAGRGVDGSTLPLIVRERYRRRALEWLRETIRRSERHGTAGLGFYLGTVRDFAPVRDPKELAKLPDAERAAWEKFWVEVAPVVKKRQRKPRVIVQPQIAPAPREVGM